MIRVASSIAQASGSQMKLVLAGTDGVNVVQLSVDLNGDLLIVPARSELAQRDSAPPQQEHRKTDQAEDDAPQGGGRPGGGRPGGGRPPGGGKPPGSRAMTPDGGGSSSRRCRRLPSRCAGRPRKWSRAASRRA